LLSVPPYSLLSITITTHFCSSFHGGWLLAAYGNTRSLTLSSGLEAPLRQCISSLSALLPKPPCPGWPCTLSLCPNDAMCMLADGFLLARLTPVQGSYGLPSLSCITTLILVISLSPGRSRPFPLVPRFTGLTHTPCPYCGL
jgi:hypothetical protein